MPSPSRRSVPSETASPNKSFHPSAILSSIFFFLKDKNSNVQVKGNHVLPGEGQTRVGPRRLGQDLLSTVKTNEGQESHCDLRELGECSQILFLQMKDDKRHN